MQAASASQAPSMGGMEQGTTAMAKARDAEDRGAYEGIANAAVIKGIEENNAAIASMYKTQNLNDYNNGQIGQQAQQIGATAGFGSQMQSEADFQRVLSGGKFQGVQQATAALSLGDVFNGTHDVQIGNKMTTISGEAIAKTLGNDSTIKTTQAARGLMGSMAYDAEGNVSGNKESAKYEQGLENQARFQANQAMGLGKLGPLTTAQMNDIQYNAHAGGIAQIEQGESLRRSYGKGAAFAENYARDVATLADMKNKGDMATASAARSEFGDLAGGHGDASFKETSRLNTMSSMDKQKGSAEAYDKHTDGGAKDTVRTAAFHATSAELQGVTVQIKNLGGDAANTHSKETQEAIEKLVGDSASIAGMQAVKASERFQQRVKDGDLNEDGSIRNEKLQKNLESQDKKLVIL